MAKEKAAAEAKRLEDEKLEKKRLKKEEQKKRKQAEEEKKLKKLEEERRIEEEREKKKKEQEKKAQANEVASTKKKKKKKKKSVQVVDPDMITDADRAKRNGATESQESGTNVKETGKLIAPAIDQDKDVGVDFEEDNNAWDTVTTCLLYTSPSPRD